MVGEFKCYNCGKVFISQKDLNRHSNRKTPCLIREVREDEIDNPNRCIYCNKIFANKGNLNKHFKTCKVKNTENGIGVLFDKVKYEHELKLLKEQIAIRDLRDKERDEQIKFLMDALEKKNNQPVAPIVNNTYNITLNVSVFTEPKLLNKLTADQFIGCDNISRRLMELIYCNPDVPENHCILVKNIKDKSLIVYDGSWKLVMGKNADQALQQIVDIINSKGQQYINGPLGIYEGDIGKLLKLPEQLRRCIVAFNSMQEDINGDDVIQVLYSNKAILQKTLKDVGCHLA